MKATGWSRNVENNPSVVWIKPTELSDGIDWQNLPTEFTDGIYRRNLPTELPDGIARRNLPTEFTDGNFQLMVLIMYVGIVDKYYFFYRKLFKFYRTAM